MKAVLAVVAIASLAGCASTGMGAKPGAVADLQPTTGNSARGKVTFTQDGDSVRVSATLSGLKPGAEHGFHVHEKGDCSSGDGMSTGGHFNPLAKKHGAPDTPDRHAGDLGNLTANEYGKAEVSVMVDGISVGTGPNGVIGKGLVVHGDPDDMKTDPGGNSGDRIACGAIEA